MHLGMKCRAVHPRQQLFLRINAIHGRPPPQHAYLTTVPMVRAKGRTLNSWDIQLGHIQPSKLTGCKRGENGGVRYGRAHVAEYGRAEDAGEAVVKKLDVTVPQSPRQGTHEGEHDAHGPERAPTRVRDHVAQSLAQRRWSTGICYAAAPTG